MLVNKVDQISPYTSQHSIATVYVARAFSTKYNTNKLCTVFFAIRTKVHSWVIYSALVVIDDMNETVKSSLSAP